MRPPAIRRAGASVSTYRMPTSDTSQRNRAWKLAGSGLVIALVVLAFLAQIVRGECPVP
jgi:hypothetical protein